MEVWCSELRSLLLRLGVSSHVFILFVCRQVLALFAGVSLAVGFIRVRKWWAVEGERRFMELQSDVGGLELPTRVAPPAPPARALSLALATSLAVMSPGLSVEGVCVARSCWLVSQEARAVPQGDEQGAAQSDRRHA